MCGGAIILVVCGVVSLSTVRRVTNKVEPPLSGLELIKYLENFDITMKPN